MEKEYYFEEDYPDCLGESRWYNAYPACYTCLWKQACLDEIKASENIDAWEDKYDY